jgi:hypothetical protein
MKQIYPLVFIMLFFALLSMKSKRTISPNIVKSETNLIKYSTSYTGELTIKPNPVHELLVIELPVQINLDRIEIYNIFGDLTLTNLSSKKKINVKSLPTGIYYLKIYSNDNTITKRFVKK